MSAKLHKTFSLQQNYTAQVDAALSAVYAQVDHGKYGFFNQLTQDIPPEMTAFATTWRRAYDTFVILGTGGSNLAAKTFYEVLGPSHLQSSTPRFFFMDNVDPQSFDLLFQQIDPHKTGFLVISKSGSTAETMCQFLHVIQHLESLDSLVWQDHVCVITENKASPLKELSTAHALRTFDHPLDVGGRFSAFSVVAQLPCLLMGLSLDSMRQGALWALQHLKTETEFRQMVAYRYGLMQEHAVSQVVLMPYVDRLQAFTQWHRQLWAESLGKEGKGSTPIPALGTVDQHSQLQLYLEGPKDKFFTLIFEKTTQRSSLSAALTQGPLSYLAGKHMGHLLEAEAFATQQSLNNHGCPTYTLTLEALDEETVAVLMVLSMVDVLVTAHLMQVDPFSQPAVEESKILTRRYLQEGRAA